MEGILDLMAILESQKIKNLSEGIYLIIIITEKKLCIIMLQKQAILSNGN